MKAEESKVQDASGSALSKDLAAKKAEELKVAADSLTQLSKDRAASQTPFAGPPEVRVEPRSFGKPIANPFLYRQAWHCLSSQNRL